MRSNATRYLRTTRHVFVEKATTTVSQNLKKGQLVILESTTYPGTTKEIIKPILETSGLFAGKDFFLAYSPEREDPEIKISQFLEFQK